MASSFTPLQLEAYLDHVSMPEKYRPASNPPLDLALLTAIHVHQIATIPYENLSLHYSKERTVSLDPQRLHEKVLRNGRGGYCMENTIILLHVLRAYGFNVYATGVRIRIRVDGVPTGDYIGWVHSLLIIRLPDGSKYISDCAFGGDGATKPLSLEDGVETVNLGTQEVRLVRESIPQLSDQSQKLWIYQYRNSPDKPWNAHYCFREMEFTQQDFEVMNYYASKSPDSLQVNVLLAVKFLKTPSEERISGKVMMANGVLKENLGGKTRVVKDCNSEEERIMVLKEVFGITLTDEEKSAIRGHPTDLSKNRPLF